MGPIDAKERQLAVLERLELHLLPEEGLKFDEPLPIQWLEREVLKHDPTGLSLKVSKPGHVTLTVTPVGALETRPPILLQGNVRATIDTACVRCLEALDMPVDTEIEATLMFQLPPKDAAPDPAAKKRGKKARLKEEAALEEWNEEFDDPSALDDGAYDASGIDLAGVVREAVLLGLDMNPVCEDEPACDERTEALLAEANRPFREAEEAGDPRWAALAALRKDD